MHIELKGIHLPVVLAIPDAPDSATLIDSVGNLLTQRPGFFEGEALVLDLSALGEHAAAFDWAALLALFRSHGLAPIGVCNAAPAAAAIGPQLGLAMVSVPKRDSSRRETHSATPVIPNAPEPSIEAEQAEEPDNAFSSPYASSLVVDKPVRSGQRIYAREADLVVLGAVNPGAELIADGNIHVYGPLRGKALAGAQGKMDAWIFCTHFDPELVSIAGIYQSDPGAARKLSGRPAKIHLVNDVEGEHLVFEPLALD